MQVDQSAQLHKFSVDKGELVCIKISDVLRLFSTSTMMLYSVTHFIDADFDFFRMFSLVMSATETW